MHVSAPVDDRRDLAWTWRYVELAKLRDHVLETDTRLVASNQTDLLVKPLPGHPATELIHEGNQLRFVRVVESNHYRPVSAAICARDLRPRSVADFNCPQAARMS